MECAPQTVVLIPKENREFDGISILEVMCKSVSGVVNCCIEAAVYFHNTLHNFRGGRVTETASLEVNFIQQLIATRKEVVYEVLVDLQKVYDALNWEH